MLNTTQIQIIHAMADDKSGKELIAAVGARSALTASTHKRLVIALASEKLAAEIEAAIISGASLAPNTQKACIIMLASAVAGNDLINAIQTIDPIKPIAL